MKGSISVRGVFYEALRAHARKKEVTISSIVETEIEKGLLEEEALRVIKEKKDSLPVNRLELIAEAARRLAG